MERSFSYKVTSVRWFLTFYHKLALPRKTRYCCVASQKTAVLIFCRFRSKSTVSKLIPTMSLLFLLSLQNSRTFVEPLPSYHWINSLCSTHVHHLQDAKSSATTVQPKHLDCFHFERVATCTLNVKTRILTTQCKANLPARLLALSPLPW
jgi:hypothetical protein